MWLQKRFRASLVLVCIVSLFLIAAVFAGNLHAEEYELPYVLEFDGSDDYVELPVRPRDIDDEGITFSCWIKIAPGAGRDRMKIFSGYSGIDGDKRWDFEYSRDGGDRKLWFNEWGGAGDQAGSRTLEEDTWYFVSFTWEPGEEVVLYIDGEKDAEFNIENSTLDDGENFRIAGRPDGFEKEWEGNISDATLWQGIRTHEEIREEMNTPPAGDEEGLVGYWPMEEGEGETVYDKSPGENHASISDASWAEAIIPAEILDAPPGKVLPVLLETAAEHSSTTLRSQAVSGLAILEVDAEEIKPALLDILEDTEDVDEVRLAALDTLGELENVERDEFLPVLYEILEDTDETDEIRLEVLDMLGSLYNTAQDKVSTLLNLIENSEDSEQVRLEALDLLSVMDFAMDRISPVLLEVLKDVEETEEVSLEVVRFLQRKGQDDVLEEALPALGEALRQPEYRGVAITLLSEIGSDDALALMENVVDDLVEELGDEDPAVRRRAVQQLVEVGSAAEHAVPEIQARLEDVREDLDNATIVALRDINITAFDEIVEDTIKAIEHERVIRSADLYLIEPVVTITAFEAERSEGGRHDYYSEGDYWWPDPSQEDGLPYTRRDGQSNPGNFLKHRFLMRRLSLHVPTLAAAYLLTDDQRYADHAVAHLEAWFVEEETRMNPNLRYGQAIPGRTSGRYIGIIDTLHLAEIARAAKVLRNQQTIPAETLEGIEDWFEDYLEWLTTSSMGRGERDHGNNHSTAWLVQVAALADFLEDEAILEESRDRVRDIIIPRQMDDDGSFPREIDRTKPYGYSLFNWDLLGILHQILSTSEENLWHFETDDGRGMEQANDFIVPYIDDKDSWPHDPDIEYHEDWPMRHPTLLFSGMAYDRPELIELWEELPADSSVHEVIRNFPVRQPLLWLD